MSRGRLHAWRATPNCWNNRSYNPALTHRLCLSSDFVTQNCPGTIGPSYGEVLRFDPNSKSDSYVVPSTTLDCWITLRGRPTEPGMPQYYATLTWRTSMFSVRSYNGSGSCAGAYVEVGSSLDYPGSVRWQHSWVPHSIPPGEIMLCVCDHQGGFVLTGRIWNKKIIRISF